MKLDINEIALDDSKYCSELFTAECEMDQLSDQLNETDNLDEIAWINCNINNRFEYCKELVKIRKEAKLETDPTVIYQDMVMTDDEFNF